MHVGTAVGGTIALPLGRTQQMPVVHLQDALQGREQSEGGSRAAAIHVACIQIA